MNIETIAVHAGGEPDPATAAIAPPIHLSTTFEHGPATEILHGYTYIRDENPTQDRLEAAMAQLECARQGNPGKGLEQIKGTDPSTRSAPSGSASSSDAETTAALSFSSGMGAAVALLQSLEPGAHVIFPEDVYVHVRVAQQDYLPKWGITATVVDMSGAEGVEAVRRAMRPETRLVWVETPSNPRMNITDVAAVVKAAREHGGRGKSRSLTPPSGVRDDNEGPLVVVDNTFATPVLQRPLELGADIVLHSTTKYCGGHSDVQGGALVLKSKGPLYDKLYRTRMILGAVCSPFNSWLVLRGLRTLPVRMERHAVNAMAVARALEGHKRIERVFYPGLASHAGHEIAKRQMKGFGGMLSILVKGGWDEAISVAAKVRLWRNATSLGGVESLIEHRASAEGPGSTAPKNLLRLSVGLENAEDLVADLMRALGE
jgi:cystathionine gamma-synthase